MAVAVRSLHAKIVIVAGNSKWIKIIIFVLNYLTVLVYTKTIIHLSIGGYCLQFGTTSNSHAARKNLFDSFWHSNLIIWLNSIDFDIPNDQLGTPRVNYIVCTWRFSSWKLLSKTISSPLRKPTHCFFFLQSN